MRMRKRILVPTQGPEDWKRLLAQPDRHWKTGFSAKTLAYAWEAANDFPPEVRAALERGSDEAFKNLEMLLAIPEYEVALEGGDRGSHNDVFVLARGQAGLVAVVVEGKVDEDFGPTLDQWLKNTNSESHNLTESNNFTTDLESVVARAKPVPSGKPRRWESLKSLLSLPNDCPLSIRYQLVHRAASAVLEAQRFGATHAVMVVHSFSPTNNHLSDFDAFVGLYGKSVKPGLLVLLGEPAGSRLWTAWVSGDQRFLAR
jgi:hypothetical protein